MLHDGTYDELAARGMIKQVSDDAAVRRLFSSEASSIYVGFDPTATSLHVGHLLPIMVMSHLQRFGHRPIVLVGGATGMIGDPSGRSNERALLTPEQVAVNTKSVRLQLGRFLSFEGHNAALMVDNNDWIAQFTYVDWLREVGKYFTVNYMLAKESVRARLEDREYGISYTEFSYMLMQAYDFLHLYREQGCRLQGGGNDQWGNITAGIDLIRKVAGAEVYGITFPLITTSSGEKFGKSAGNAVWLDPALTSVYQFYQYWIRTDDRDVEAFLKLFTFLPCSEIENICISHREAPESRGAQKVLASEITRTVHGQVELANAQKAASVLFGGEIGKLSDRELMGIFAEVPATQLSKNLIVNGLSPVQLLVSAGVCGSKAEARRLIEGGGLYINNRRVEDPACRIDTQHLASESVLVLRTGKKDYHLVSFS